MNKLPNELKYIIYKYCEDETKIKLHTIFKLSYKIGCPLNFKPFNPTLVFKIPKYLQGDITNIIITCNPYVFYNRTEYICSIHYNYGIKDILKSYDFFINDKKIQKIDIGIIQMYLSKDCKYRLNFWFNGNGEFPLPNIIGVENKIKLNFITYVSNLKIHITTTKQEYTFNLN